MSQWKPLKILEIISSIVFRRYKVLIVENLIHEEALASVKLQSLINLLSIPVTPANFLLTANNTPLHLNRKRIATQFLQQITRVGNSKIQECPQMNVGFHCWDTCRVFIWNLGIYCLCTPDDDDWCVRFMWTNP